MVVYRKTKGEKVNLLKKDEIIIWNDVNSSDLKITCKVNLFLVITLLYIVRCRERLITVRDLRKLL